MTCRLRETSLNFWPIFWAALPLTPVSISSKMAVATKAIAEARLMRACAYFYMLRIWGPVILIEDNQKLVDNPVRPLNREEDVFQFIINDLNYAVDNLSEQSDKGRATSWAAKGILAKVYLARSGWNNGGTRDEGDLELARQYASDVCENSGLDLMTNYEDLFKYKNNNNQESLLAMQWVPLGEWYECNTLLSDLAFSTEVTGGVNCWSSYNGSIDMLQQYELADTLRRNATFFTKGSYYSYICIKDGGYTYKGTASPIKKGVPGGPDDDNDGKVKQMNSPLNTYILRLADVYLTYAEACLGNNSTLSDGRGLYFFNRVRERAKINKKSSITLDDIIRERTAAGFLTNVKKVAKSLRQFADPRTDLLLSRHTRTPASWKRCCRRFRCSRCSGTPRLFFRHEAKPRFSSVPLIYRQRPVSWPGRCGLRSSPPGNISAWYIPGLRQADRD